MQLNLKKIVTNLDGKAIKDGENDLTLKDASIAALLGNIKGDETLEGKKKYELYTLTKKLEESEEEVELTSEEITLIKERVGKYYTTLFVGRIWDLLESKS